MAAYLVERLFCPTEAQADPASGVKLTSTAYLLDPVQILAVLQLARHLDPARFGETFERFFPIWSVQWFFQWLQALDPHDSYFKFNLEHAAAYLLLTLEDDPERRARLALGFRAVRRIVKNHANPWFNLVELAALEGDDESPMAALAVQPARRLAGPARGSGDALAERGPDPALLDGSQAGALGPLVPAALPAIQPDGACRRRHRDVGARQPGDHLDAVNADIEVGSGRR